MYKSAWKTEQYNNTGKLNLVHYMPYFFVSYPVLLKVPPGELFYWSVNARSLFTLLPYLDLQIQASVHNVHWNKSKCMEPFHSLKAPLECCGLNKFKFYKRSKCWLTLQDEMRDALFQCRMIHHWQGNSWVHERDFRIGRFPPFSLRSYLKSIIIIVIVDREGYLHFHKFKRLRWTEGEQVAFYF